MTKNLSNKILLYVDKTELVLFTSSKKQLDYDLKMKLNWKRLYETGSTKYLGIQIDKILTWKQQINHVAHSQCYLVKIKTRIGYKNSEVSLLCYI